jgi:hypothetical protein
MTTLKIFPCTQEEKVVKVQEYSNFEGPFRHVIDDILILLMESIFEIYQEKRRETAHFPQYQKVFQDLRHDAGVLMSFAGQIQKKLNRADTVNQLVAFQNRMSADGD